MLAQITPFRKKRILIVDDEPDSGDILAQCLGKMYDVVLARDGQEGLERAATYQPDLIISDVTMPRLSGLAMVNRLRRQQGSKVPVIFISALASPRDVIAGISAGARHYLTKPVELADLKKRVAKALGQ
ncbi:MAG: response regulator [Pseudomonadota bacterium]